MSGSDEKKSAKLNLAAIRREHAEALAQYMKAKTDRDEAEQRVRRYRDVLTACETLARELYTADLAAERPGITLDIEPQRSARTVFEPDTAPVAELMVQYLRRHPDEEPHLPKQVLIGIAREFGRRLSDGAITTTRDRRKDLFEKAPGKRGAFRLKGG